MTGKFEVQAARATQLGTIVYYPMPGSYTNRTIERDYESVDFRAGVALDPTPVPVEALLLARFPQLAKEVSLEVSVGWVSGSMPTQAAGDLDQARALVKPVSPPVLLDATNYLIGGALGVIREQRPDGTSVRHVVNTAQTITAVLPLQDGRWLAGAEQGYLAMSSNRGKDWRALPPIPPDNVILHLIQSQDTQLFMVTARASEIAIYESSDHPIAWQEIKRIPSARVENARFKQFGEHARYRPAFVAASNDRLVVLTAQPDTISSLDFRTNDGGLTWQAGESVEGWMARNPPLFWQWSDRRLLHTLWADPSGRVLYTIDSKDRLSISHDGGRTWQEGR